MHFLTLPGHFKCPLVRDWILLHGMLDTSRATCKRILSGCASCTERTADQISCSPVPCGRSRQPLVRQRRRLGPARHLPELEALKALHQFWH